jgi:CRISPR-associated protein Cmr6
MPVREALAQGAIHSDATTNLALWLDRYVPEVDQERIGQHQANAVETIRSPEGYGRAKARREAALRELTGDFADGTTRLFELTLQGRAVVGIGAASIRETNLSLLRPWGVPFIPGSALKGLASHVAHDRGGEWKRPSKAGEEAGALHAAVFGDVKRGGSVVFHDAWWLGDGDRIPAHGDTMTVHHAPHYQGKAAPLDWDEPNPVGFLSTTGKYLVALTGPPEALDAVQQLLEEGLKERGIGAKTAAGYGRATLERCVSVIVRKLQEFDVSAVTAGTVSHRVTQLMGLARQARLPDERREVEATARRLVQSAQAVWKAWLLKDERTDEERQWLAPALAALEPAVQARPRAEAVVVKQQGTVTPHTVRVRYRADKKSPARYELEIDLPGGRSKAFKHHLVDISSDDLERVRASGEDGALVELYFEGDRPRRPARE